MGNSNTSATVEAVRSSRDVYSYEGTPKDLAPLGAKPGSRTFAKVGKSGYAPTELRTKEKDREAINISPLWGEATNKSSVTLPT